jgi:hypothetical protein
MAVGAQVQQIGLEALEDLALRRKYGSAELERIGRACRTLVKRAGAECRRGQRAGERQHEQRASGHDLPLSLGSLNSVPLNTVSFITEVDAARETTQ